MSMTITAAGQALVARLQAEGKPLRIDRFLFAHVGGQDHTQPINPAAGVPMDSIVYDYAIPEEYRAYVNPNQVVYSALLGSDIGTYQINWQGLYCSDHATLIAVATFPALEKRAYDPDSNTPGNNLTRNFLLEFTGAREATHITLEAKVWQLDFTVRLSGIDERERLSNRDIYGRACFVDDGWLVSKNGRGYSFAPGFAYIEGIRAELTEALVVQKPALPCEVYLDVRMEASGSDMAAVAEPLFVAPDVSVGDYLAPPPARVRHYRERVAHIDSAGEVTDLRPIGLRGGAVNINTLHAVSSDDSRLTDARTPKPHTHAVEDIIHAVSSDDVRLEDARTPLAHTHRVEDITGEYFALSEVGQYRWFEDTMPRAGFIPLRGLKVANISRYPDMIKYLQTSWGQARCTTQEDWDARHNASFYTAADGSKIGWGGKGGVNRFVWDEAADTLLVPDLSGLTPEQIGYDALGVGETRPDAIRDITGTIHSYETDFGVVGRSGRVSGAFAKDAEYSNRPTGAGSPGSAVLFRAARVVPTGPRVTGRTYLSDLRVYLGTPAS